MNYNKFKNIFINYPLILSKHLKSFEDEQTILNQLNRWKNKGLIIKLKKGIYILNEIDRKILPSDLFIANQLYYPSYISLEFALSYYGLIPEKVTQITSVTTKKTDKFINKLGTYIYQHIKTNAFKGFKIIKDDNDFDVFIAEPEKAILDFLYLKLNDIKIFDNDIFYESFRFQNVEKLKSKKIISFAKLFNNTKLIKLSEYFCEFIKSEQNYDRNS